MLPMTREILEQNQQLHTNRKMFITQNILPSILKIRIGCVKKSFSFYCYFHSYLLGKAS